MFIDDDRSWSMAASLTRPLSAGHSAKRRHLSCLEESTIARSAGLTGCWAGGVLGLSDEMVAGGARPAWFATFTAMINDATVAAIVADGVIAANARLDILRRRIAMSSIRRALLTSRKPIPPADHPMRRAMFDMEKPQGCAGTN